MHISLQKYLKILLIALTISPGFCEINLRDTAKVFCNTSETHVNNYLTKLSNISNIGSLEIENCTTFNELTIISQLFRDAELSSLIITNDFVVKLSADHFRGLENLLVLKIINSSLAELETDCFQNLQKARVLVLAWNKFTHLPATIFNNKSMLNFLNLEHNSLKHLSEGIFDKLFFLETLYLNANELTSLPDNIFRLSALQTLMLNDNKLAAISENLFAKLYNLKLLDLSGNQLLSVHGDAFSKMWYLKDLFLNNNRMELQPPNGNLTLPPDLKRLRLDVNAITNFNSASFRAYISLSYINVSHNSIANIEANDLVIWAKRNLSIDLSYNLIRELDFPQNSPLTDEDLLKKKPFQAFYLAHNPWRCDCQSKNMLRFVKDYKHIIADVEEIRCNDTSFNKNILNLESSDVCPPEQSLTITLVSLVCIIALIGMLLLLS